MCERTSIRLCIRKEKLKEKKFTIETTEEKRNKAGYTALGAPKHLYKRRGYGPTDGRTDRQTDRRTDRPSYRGASYHLKTN